ncbi:MAG TPA: hypothetical protein DCO83_00020 [Mucilaginibacter sp.]|nr:hypothetical protein [Mucilaginibacter sp.]
MFKGIFLYRWLDKNMQGGNKMKNLSRLRRSENGKLNPYLLFLLFLLILFIIFIVFHFFFKNPVF